MTAPRGHFYDTREKRKARFLLAVLAGCMLVVHAARAESTKGAVDYSLYAQVLDAYVNGDGRVDYRGLKADMEKLNAFVRQVEEADISAWTPVEQKAFWINAYNAITLKTVADAYPVKGIRRINFGLVWEIPRRAAGQRLSLGHIEHKVLRPLGDPRIHFAINCASIGCPKLPNKPFYPDTLDARLDEEARRFINDGAKVRMDKDQNVLYLSSIFHWFNKDFLVAAGNFKEYILPYIVKEEDAQYLKSNDMKIKFLDYDWGLNAQDDN